MEFSLRGFSLSIIIFIGVLVGAAAVGVTVADTAPASASSSTSDAAADVEIDGALQNAEGEVEVIVRFESVDRVTVQASENPTETMKTKADAAQGPLQRYAARTEGVTVKQGFWLTNAALVTVDTDRISLEELGRIEGVGKIHRNFEMTVQTGATQSYSPVAASDKNLSTSSSEYTYGLKQINAPQVWEEYGTKGEGVKVAVLDTGVDNDHPDIDLYTDDPSDPTYPGGWAEFDSDGNMKSGSTPYDSAKHGTHVTGTVSGGNESGTWIGVAPEAEMMHGLVLQGGKGSFAQITAGMEWAVEENADVMSMSLGVGCDEEGPYYVDDFINPVQNALDSGTIVVASIGNDGEGCSGSPGNVYDSLSVGASNSNGGIGSFSSGEQVDTSTAWGTNADSSWPDQYIVPDIAAPGVDVYSSVPGGGYEGYWDGTSMAAPHVSGAIALMVASSATDIDPGTIRRTLEETAWKPDSGSRTDAKWEIDGNDSRYGAGIIDAHAAVSAVASGTIEGQIVDNASGVGISDATVTAENGSTIFNTTTGTDGSFELQVESESTYNLTVEAAGYENASVRNVSVGSGESVPYNPSLHGDANVTLSVAELHFGDPIENATVTATNESTGTYDAVAATGDGAYVIENVSSASAYELVVSAAGYESNATTVTDLSSGNTTAVGERLLVGNAAVAGTLTDAYGETADGTALPIENATIEVTRPDANSSLVIENATDATGAYTAAVPGTDANYTVTATATYYEATNLTTGAVGDNASATVVLRAAGNATLSGTVNATGVQTENATITATTDAPGWEGAAWGNETAAENVSVAIPGTGGNYTVNATSRAFSTNSTTVEGVATDADFGTLSIRQLARYFGVDDLSAPETVEEGDTVTVEATIVNLGTDDGNESATFRVDGTAAGSRNVSLNGTDNASGTGEAWTNVSVSFTHTPDSPSSVSYAIATDNETPTANTAVEESAGGGGGGGGGFAPPASPYFIIGDSTFSATEVEVGESVRIETMVKNTGNAPGETPVLFTVGNRLRLGEVTVTVDAKSSTIAPLEHAFDEPGEYELEANGETIGTVTVVRPAADAEEADDEDTNEEADDEGAGAGDGDGLSGFGAAVAVIALVSVALATRQRA